VRQYEGRYPEFKDLAKRVYAYNQNLMQYRVDSGLISKDTAEFLQKRYPDYVPTFHQQDGVSTAERGKGTKVGKTVKKATGNTGNNPFVDMDKAMAQQTMSVVRESAKNRFGQRLLNEDISQDYIINVESLAQQKALAELHDEDGFKSEQTNKDNTFTVYKDGKAYEITMTPAMYDAIKSLSKMGESDVLAVKVAIGANNIYKKAITSWNPIFTVKNLAKDLQDALLYTTASPKEFAKNYAEAVRQIKNNGDDWKLYQALGGTASSVYNMDRGVELPKDGAWAKLVGGISYLNLAVEQAPRLAEFLATTKKGNRTQEELMEAMYRAADITTNFGRSGDWTKMLNSSFVPFLNPSIQGVDKLVRTFKANPKKMTLGVAANSFVDGATKAATLTETGTVAMYSDFACAVVVKGKIVASLNDAIQPKFTTTVLGLDLTSVSYNGTKRELRYGYGMEGKVDANNDGVMNEWYKQSAAFSAHVVGMTADQVANMATEANFMGYQMTTDADLLAAGCTIQITDIKAVVAEAARNAR
jgi:hypothetical protein